MNPNLAAIAAFTFWGVIPLFWKLLQTVSAPEILCHRILWSAPMLFMPLLLKGKPFKKIIALTKNKRHLCLLLISALFIGSNWLIYIWAVNAGYVLETSLGYYINPFISVAMGMLVFRERLRKLQWFALGFAFLGVVNAGIKLDTFPWIALSLAFTFAFYGLLRKLAAIDSLLGLLFETWILSPLCLAYMYWYESTTHASALLHSNAWTLFLLVCCGFVTSLPLLLFGYATMRIPLSRVGFFQFIAPSMQFCLAVFVFREPFNTQHFITFAFIFVGIGIYLYDLWKISAQKILPSTTS